MKYFTFVMRLAGAAALFALAGPALAQNATRTRLTPAPSPSAVGQSVRLIAEVDAAGGGAATGSVLFRTGVTALGTRALAAPGAGQATVATGGHHSCALTGAGGVKCWGYNFDGELGDGTTTDRFTPVNVAGLASGVKAIAAGYYHTCALTSAGGVKCWGYNDDGELGDGTKTDRLTPVNVAGLASGVVAIAAGYYHTCALTSAGGVSCWGYNGSGQLGDGTKTDRLIAGSVAGLSSGVLAIAAGEDHTCALTGAGGVKCWGYNGDGRLGDGTTADRLTPVNVSSLASGVAAIAAGDDHTCALTGAGAVKCWGYNGDGRLGDGTTAPRLIPVNVSGLASGVAAIAAGGSHSCALTSAGGVRCWGQNRSGQLGDGTTAPRLNPVNVSGLASGVAAIAAGASHSCALTSAGDLKCWGDNAFGQLGDGRGGYRATPATVAGLSSGVAAIAGGDSHNCALTIAGGVKCWGDNAWGALGDGTQTSRLTPVDVSGLASGVARIAGGDDHTCALTGAGRVKCWGENGYGQLGDGTTTRRLTPVDLVGVPSNMAVIAVGARHGCARALRGAGGYVVCWGNNEHGQLGDGTTTPRYSAVRVPLPSMFGLVAGDYHTCASYLDGGVRCWGKNSSGQLGNGTFTQQPIPVVVPGLEGVIAMVAGRNHTCALTNGGVKCWGENYDGQLGDGTRTNRNAPVDVSGLTSGVIGIAAGGNHTCAITGAGAVKCWGANYAGQLGDGTRTRRLTPVNVPSLASGVARIAAGGSHTCAVTSAGGAQCWGNNFNGQLGDGVPTFRATPITTLSLLALVRSRAQLTTANLGRGLHSLSVIYSGDANHSGSTGSASHLVK